MANIRKPKSALKFNRPAEWWGGMYREALPTGNGLIGAAVYGGAGYENIMITHADLMWQGHAGVLQDVADKIKDVRKLIDESNFKKAQDILTNGLISKGYRPINAVPLPLCDFRATMPVERVREYARIVNMDTGEISVTFKDGGTRYDRDLFVSRENDIIAYEITKSGSKMLDVEFALAPHDKADARTPFSYSKMPENVSVKTEKFFLYYSQRNDNGTDCGAVARINHYGGTMEVTQSGIRIKGAERIFVIIKVFIESVRDKEWKNLQAALTAAKTPYDKMLKAHAALHGRLFSKADFDLSAGDRDAAIEDLIDHAIVNCEIKDALIEKLWQFGRYLLICSTKEGSRLLSPYGLWCGEYKAVNASPDASGQLFTLYSPALLTGLEESLLNVFGYYEAYTDDLKKNASRLFGCRGYLVPGIAAHGTGLIGSVDPSVLHFTAAAGMLCRLYYDYYLYTGDIKFLKARALPFMKETALFYEEFFKIEADGMYSASPSYSPDNTPLNHSDNGNTLYIAKNCAIDFEVARELFTNLIAASEEGGMYKQDIDKWKDMLNRIPAYRLGSDGCVREYLDMRLYENHQSKSIMQLYPLYPGAVDVSKDQDFVKAASLTLKKRMQNGVKQHTAGSYARMASAFARLGDSSNASECVSNIIRYMLMDNMVTLSNDWRGMGIGAAEGWASYNIEGNTGITAAYTEMALSSYGNKIIVLPALPESIKNLNAEGLMTRAGVEVGIEYDGKKGILNIKLKARKGVEVALYFPQGIKKIKGPGAESLTQENPVLNVALPGGKAVTYDIKY